MSTQPILNFNKELLKRLSDIGFKAGDCKYIELYSDYDRMRKSGEKVTYIVSVLSEKYNVSERKIYMVINRFGKDCTTCAV